ncbi:hypothetical protein D3C85_1701530 [compost metagenome]
MMANVIWNIMNTPSGMEAASGCTVSLASSFRYSMPSRKMRSKPPMYGLPGMNARL